MGDWWEPFQVVYHGTLVEKDRRTPFLAATSRGYLAKRIAVKRLGAPVKYNRIPCNEKCNE